MRSADLLITGGTVLTVDEPGTVVPDGAVVVRDGTIVEVGPADVVAGRYEPAEVLDVRGCLVMPGLVNTHAHLAMNLFRGEADDVSLEEFLRRVLRAELVQLTAEAVAVGVEAALAECLRGGITTALDMYWYPEAATEVADRVGFRLLNGPSFMDVIDPDGRDFDRRMAWAEELLTQRRAADPAAPVWVMPHSAYMLSREQLERVMALARRFDARVHTHAAESPGETAAVLDRHGERPIDVLDAAGVLGPRTVLAHGVQLDAGEISLLARRGTAVAHCPVSNLFLGCGIAPLPQLLQAGVPVGIGTDGAASCGALDIFAGIRLAAMLHKGVTQDPRTVGAERAVRLATTGGAAALGLGDRVGALTAGRRADIVVADLHRLHVVPNTDVWSAVAYGLTPADVRHTIVDGRVLLRDRVLRTIDEASVLDRMTDLRRTRSLDLKERL
ncbi:amidohydrolase [Blastococcus sp. CT_GayMR19]|uniref:amidohydrolase family protein n=1 Tax=Blastococcus sp. CT_GayMR19 TaxID=2559608 RepID=UPI001073663E|nr:amidohydrolase [Blastococcus sp. CT_GayMR19]TFV79184.1 amidohydrolase [Blastococcus sp. CT_GayMR19]